MEPTRRPAAAGLLHCWAGALLLLVTGAATAAPGVVLAGRMGQRALLVIDGRAHAMAVGDTAGGVRLLGWTGDAAEVELGGKTQMLRLGAAPAQLAAAGPAPSGREIVIPAGQGGHFTAAGSIQGHNVQFMVDTGATLVSLGRDDAQRMGLDLRDAAQGYIQTANGQALVHLVTLPHLRVGEVEVHNVGAVVLPMPMPFVLLGNNFLSRFQMRRENDVMRLEAR
jgi:aspartyl protease family protein